MYLMAIDPLILVIMDFLVLPRTPMPIRFITNFTIGLRKQTGTDLPVA